MPRIAANLSYLFTERPFLERFAAAAACGFKAVEMHFPYAHPKSELRDLLRRHDLAMVLLNTAMGPCEGDFGLAAVPGRQADFRQVLEQALDYAAALGAGLIHVMSGLVRDGEQGRARETFFENLAWAAAQARGSGITLLVEPLNSRDRPDYFVSRSDEVVLLLQALRQPGVKLLFDFYHVQIMEGDLAMRLERHWPWVGHIQFASVPGRAEPDAGEIAYPFLFELLDRLGWQGWASAEYRPRGTTEAGLAWAAAYGIRAPATPSGAG